MDLTNRFEFVRMAVLFEAGLIVVAGAVGWGFDINPLATFAWEWRGFLWGVAAAVPLFLLFLLMERYPIGPLRPIKEFLIEALGPSLAVSRWYDLLVIAAMAGIAEEILFRGVLHKLLGLWLSNVAFGLAHFITPAYAILAAIIGLFLGGLYDQTGNLLTPMVTHGLYDFLAFLALARTCRRQQGDVPPPVCTPRGQN